MIDSTYFLLIGIEQYVAKSLPSLPAANRNVSDLKQILQKRYGVPVDRIADHNRRIDDLNRFYQELTAVVENESIQTIVLYYSGHGLKNDDDQFRLSIYSSEPERLTRQNSIHPSDLNEIFRRRPTLNVIVILDCCFSELGINAFDQRNRCIIAASPFDKVSYYKLGQDYSSFTDKLINILNSGIENGPQFLSFQNVFDEIYTFRKPQELEPRISSAGEISTGEFFENQKISREITEEDEKYLTDLYVAIKTYNPTLGSVDNFRDVKKIVLGTMPYMISNLLKNIFDERRPASDEYLFHFYGIVKKFLLYIIAAKASANHRSRRVLDTKIDLSNVNNYTSEISKFFESVSPDDEMYSQERTVWNQTLCNKFIEIDSDTGSISGVQLKQKLIAIISDLAFLSRYSFLSIRMIEVHYPHKYVPEPMYLHEACLLTGEYLTGYSMSLNLRGTELPLSWSSFYFNQAVILTDDVNKLNGESKTVINMWPFLIDPTVYSPKGGQSSRKTPSLLMLDAKNGSKYTYRPIEFQKNGNPIDYKELNKLVPKEIIDQQFATFEHDSGLIA